MMEAFIKQNERYQYNLKYIRIDIQYSYCKDKILQTNHFISFLQQLHRNKRRSNCLELSRGLQASLP